MIPILYQDNAIIVCVKAPGILSQSAPNCTESMLSLLSAQCGGEVYPVHRLDRETGGVMVYARTAAAAAKLSAAVAERTMEKKYLCIVSGCPRQSEATLEDLLFKDSSRNKTFVVTRMRKGVKAASLTYRTLASRNGTSLLQVALHTGRTHQIRVQFASRHLPLLGDSKYGGERGELALWSYSLSFPHPANQKMLSFSALPSPAGCWAVFADDLEKADI